MKRTQVKQYILLLLSAAICAVPTIVSAQKSTVESLLRQCAEIDHDRQRLSCYDQVLRPRKIDAAAQKSPSATETWEATKPEVPAESPQAPSVAEEKPVVKDTFGLDKKRSKESAKRSVFVTELSKNSRGKYLFKTEDGQEWLQIDQRNVRFDRAPFSAVIRTASLGSFFLKPASSKVSIKVRRTK